MKKTKKEMVKAGKIEDMRIFKLMYLEKSINETKLLAELKKRAINDQIEQLKLERQSHVRSFELRAATLTTEVAQLRLMFEEDYDISLVEWGYDDATGILVSLPPSTLKDVHSQKALQKDIDAEKSVEKRQRAKGKRKVKADRWETAKPDGPGENSTRPPAKASEV